MLGMPAAFVECTADGRSDCMHLNGLASSLSQVLVQGSEQQEHVRLSQQEASTQVQTKQLPQGRQPGGQVVDHANSFDQRQQLIDLKRTALGKAEYDSLRMLGHAHADGFDQRQQRIELERKALENKKYDSWRMLGQALEKQPTSGLADTMAGFPKLSIPVRAGSQAQDDVQRQAIPQPMNFVGMLAKNVEPAIEAIGNAVHHQMPFLSSARSQLSSFLTQQRSPPDQAPEPEDLSLEGISKRLVEDEKRILTALIAKKQALSSQPDAHQLSSMLETQTAASQYSQPGHNQYDIGYSSGVAAPPSQLLNREDYDFSQPAWR